MQEIYQQSYLSWVAWRGWNLAITISQVNQICVAASNGVDINAGNFPAELSRLSSLERLNVRNNQLSGKEDLSIFSYKWWMWKGGPGHDLFGRDAVQAFFASIPLTELNLSLRHNFLMFLHGCNLRDLMILPQAAGVIGLRSVVKCMSIPYYDRSVMEFIHHSRNSQIRWISRNLILWH